MKPKHLITFAVVCLLVGLPVGFLIQAEAQRKNQNTRQTPASSYRFSGPYTHENLTVFLVHGEDRIKKTFLTLEEALAQKKVRVYETKNVNELAIRNLSNQDVYVQSGDIVRGGEQDRTISVDFIVPPRSGRIPIEAFCVESGRWNKRGNEDTATFATSLNSVALKDLKLAVKTSDSQQAVWENVTVAQGKLASAGGSQVLNSTSSFDLSVEDSKLKATTEAYLKSLSAIVRGKSDVIGFVFAINGEINSADIYATRALFLKLWPKLLKASAIEAIAELDEEVPPSAVTEEMVSSFLARSEQPTAATKEVTARVRLVTRQDDENIFFETRDRLQNDNWIHRNYIRK